MGFNIGDKVRIKADRKEPGYQHLKKQIFVITEFPPYPGKAIAICSDDEYAKYFLYQEALEYISSPVLDEMGEATLKWEKYFENKTPQIVAK